LAAGAAGAAGAGEDQVAGTSADEFAVRAEAAIVSGSKAMVRLLGRDRGRADGGLAGSSSALGLVVAAGGGMRSWPGPVMAPSSKG